MGAITRESVRKALLSGITADQVRVGLLLFCDFSCRGAVSFDAVSLATLCPSDERDRVWILTTLPSLDHQLPHYLCAPANA